MYYINNLGNDENIIKIVEGIYYFIPKDESNTDYKQYLEWIAEGNIAEEYNPEEV